MERSCEIHDDPEYFIAIDVGSFSVRSGIFLWNKKSLQLIEKVEIKIEVITEEENFYAQSSQNIWESICLATKEVIFKSKVNKNYVKGISFDATCSLVVLNNDGKPLSISKSGNNDQNIIMWMDHRAIEETKFINNTMHEALKTVGGKISVEMQPPKILWLKKNFPNFLSRVSMLFDLPDYLTYRATNSKTRSLCSITCKWSFDAENKTWNKSFWDSCGLSELCHENFVKIGNEFCQPGTPIGGGLTKEAAEELGLLQGIIVPGSLIDAYAGMLGAISDKDQIISIAGTSACHMLLTPSPIYINGVWGPYKDVAIPHHYVLEAGQSAVGILLDRVLQFSITKLPHPEVERHLLEAVGVNEHKSFNLMNLSSTKWIEMNSLVKNIHVNPDFLGNRSPRSDPDIRGSMIGISLDNSPGYISKLYLAAIHGLAYGFKEIITELEKRSAQIKSIKVCGGLSKNNIYLKVLSDVSGLPVTISPNEDLVLYGTAMLNVFDTIDIYDNNNENAAVIIQPDVSLAKFHQEKFDTYKKIVEFQSNLYM